MKFFATRTFALATAMILTPMTVTAFAQNAAPAPQQQNEDHSHRGKKMLAMYTKKLSLSADQQAQLKPILEDRQQQLSALRNDTTSRAEKMDKLRSIRNDSDAKINAILNDDQKKQYAALEEKQMERMKDRRNGRRGGGTYNQ